jgi:hypothetical protein
MKIRLTILLASWTICSTIGQDIYKEKSVMMVVAAALKEGRLPKTLINNVDSLTKVSSKQTYSKESIQYYPLTVPILATEENRLKHGESMEWGNVDIWIWSDEETFLHDVYWLTPTNLKIRKNELSFDFSTSTWDDKDLKYFKGTLKGRRIGEQWIIKSCKLVETKNDISLWKKLREGNAR